MKNRNRNRTDGPSVRFGFRRFGSVLSVYVYFGTFLSVLGRTGPNRTEPKPKTMKTQNRNRTDGPSVRFGFCRFGPVRRSGSVLNLRCSALYLCFSDLCLCWKMDKEELNVYIFVFVFVVFSHWNVYINSNNNKHKDQKWNTKQTTRIENIVN